MVATNMASNNCTPSQETALVPFSKPFSALMPKKIAHPFSSAHEMVTFIVGQGVEGRTFLVHRKIACEQSSVWKAAFTGGFIETTTQTYNIDDIGAETFEMAVQWLYQGRMDLVVHGKDDTGKKEQDHKAVCARQDLMLVNLWILGDKYLIKPFQNYVMSKMLAIQLTCGRMGHDAMKQAYQNTTESSPLRRLAIDQLAWVGLCPKFDSLRNMPTGLIKEAFIMLRSQHLATIRATKSAAMTDLSSHSSDYFINEEE